MLLRHEDRKSPFFASRGTEMLPLHSQGMLDGDGSYHLAATAANEREEHSSAKLTRMSLSINAMVDELNHASLDPSPRQSLSPFSNTFDHCRQEQVVFGYEDDEFTSLEDRFPFLKDDQKRTRKLLTPEQTRVLEAVLERTIYPSTPLREAIARQLRIPSRKVQIWFQNKRQGRRRFSVSNEMSEHSTDASNESTLTPGSSGIGTHEAFTQDRRDVAVRKLADDMCLSELRDEFGRQFAELRLHPACRDQRSLHPVPGAMFDANMELASMMDVDQVPAQVFPIGNKIGLHCVTNVVDKNVFDLPTPLPILRKRSATMQRSDQAFVGDTYVSTGTAKIHVSPTRMHPYHLTARNHAIQHHSLLRTTSSNDLRSNEMQRSICDRNGIRKTMSTRDLERKASFDRMPTSAVLEMFNKADDEIHQRPCSNGEQNIFRSQRSALPRRSTVVGVMTGPTPSFGRFAAPTMAKMAVWRRDENVVSHQTPPMASKSSLELPPITCRIARPTSTATNAHLAVPGTAANDRHPALFLRHASSNSNMLLNRRLGDITADMPPPIRSRLRSHSDVIYPSSSRSVRGRYQRQNTADAVVERWPIVLPAISVATSSPPFTSPTPSSSKPSPTPGGVRESLPSIAELVL